MIKESFYLKQGSIHVKFTFLIFNTLAAMRKHIIVADTLKGVHPDAIADYKDFLAYCGQPHVDRRQPRQTDIELEIGVALERFEESSLWHEVYHALSHLHTLYDNFSDGYREAVTENEEVCANLAGALIPEVRKQVLPRIRRALKCKKTKIRKNSKKDS